MSRKSKIPVEEKVKLIELYLSGKIGYRSAFDIAGVDSKTWRDWIMLYKTGGATNLLSPNQNNRYTKETKLSAVIEYQSGKSTASEICIKYGIRSVTQLKSWKKVYNSHGEFRILTGGSRMTTNRETTLAERIEIVNHCIHNETNYGATALKYQVSYSQVYGWVKKYHAMGEAGLEDRRGRRAGTLPSRTPEEELRDRVAQLERKNLDLEMENALLKKVKELERRRR
jgi:transposase-like protein